MKMPGAIWRKVRNYTEGGQEQVLGVVVHIMDGTLEGSQSWFDNPSAQASSHFGTGKDGELRQWVDTADRAWAQGSGNRTYLSVENEGRGGDSLTKAQITANAKVLAWAHKQYGVPLRLAKAVGDKGLAYHALGGAAWGGHTSCPGPKIVAQLDDIVAEAKNIANPPAPPREITEMTPDQDARLKRVEAGLKSAPWTYKNPKLPASSTPDMHQRILDIEKKLDAILAKLGK